MAKLVNLGLNNVCSACTENCTFLLWVAKSDGGLNPCMGQRPSPTPE